MFALKRKYSKGFQRNILHEDKPDFSAAIVHNFTASDWVMISLVAILSTKESISRYRMSLVRNSLSPLSGIEVAGTAAVFSIFISICDKSLSALLANQIVIGLLVDLILVTVPVGHPAFVRTEFLLPASCRLFNGFAALETYACSRYLRMTVNVRFNGAVRQLQHFGYGGYTVSFQAHIVDGVDIL